jgi:hypothetical protein
MHFAMQLTAAVVCDMSHVVWARGNHTKTLESALLSLSFVNPHLSLSLSLPFSLYLCLLYVLFGCLFLYVSTLRETGEDTRKLSPFIYIIQLSFTFLSLFLSLCFHLFFPLCLFLFLYTLSTE